MTTFTFNLPLSAETADYTTFVHGFVSNLGTIEVHVSGHCIDAGDLGHLEIDLEDVEVDLSDAIDDYTIRNAVREAKDEGACGEDFTQEVTLTEIREAYCKEHGCSPYEFLAAVGEEIAIAAMNARDQSVRHELRQEVERARAGTEADNLLVAQSLKDRDKAQELYGKQSAQMTIAIGLLSEVVRMQPGAGDYGTSYDKQREFAKTIQSFLQDIDSPVEEADAGLTPNNSTNAEA